MGKTWQLELHDNKNTLNSLYCYHRGSIYIKGNGYLSGQITLLFFSIFWKGVYSKGNNLFSFSFSVNTFSEGVGVLESKLEVTSFVADDRISNRCILSL